MRRPAVLLLLVAVILTASTSAVLAKSGTQMELVCFMKTDGSAEQSVYFMTTSSGIVHRFKLDGRHDIFKPIDKFKEPGGDWAEWTAKQHGDCADAMPEDPRIDDYLPATSKWWHKHN